jgi:hypothetical protein
MLEQSTVETILGTLGGVVLGWLLARWGDYTRAVSDLNGAFRLAVVRTVSTFDVTYSRPPKPQHLVEAIAEFSRLVQVMNPNVATAECERWVEAEAFRGMELMVKAGEAQWNVDTSELQDFSAQLQLTEGLARIVASTPWQKFKDRLSWIFRGRVR